MRQLRSFAQHHKIHVWLTVHSLHPAEAHYLLLLSDVGLSLQRTAQVIPHMARHVKDCRYTGRSAKGFVLALPLPKP